MKNKPFTYYGHGTSFYKEEFNCLIWFQKNNAAAALAAKSLAALNNHPLFTSEIPFDVDQAGDAVILIHLSRNYEYAIKAHFNAAFRDKIKAAPEDTDVWSEDKRFLPDETELRKFDEEFDAALTETHKACPILFVIKPSQPGKKHGVYSEWHDASLEVFHEQVWPALKDFFAGAQKNTMKPVLVERFNTIVNTAVGTYMKKHKSKKDRQESHLEMVDFLCMHHIVYHDEEYNLYFKWMEYEEHVFACSSLIEKLLPKDKNAVELLQGLAPYTQLVCFAGCDYPYLLLFEDPAGYLKVLIGKIDAEKNDVMSEYLRLVNNQIYEWYLDGNAEMNSELVDAVSDLVLACNPVSTLAYRDVLDRWEKLGEWEKIIADMRGRKYMDCYLLHYEKPADYLKDFIKQVPKEHHEALAHALAELAAVVAKTKSDKNIHGAIHNMVAVAAGIRSLVK